MERFKDVAIPEKYRDPDGDYIAPDGSRYSIPEELKDKVGRIPFTTEEEAARDAEEAEHAAGASMRQWQGDLKVLDAKINRPMEDLIDWILDTTESSIDDLQEPLKSAYLAKKQKRSERP